MRCYTGTVWIEAHEFWKWAIMHHYEDSVPEEETRYNVRIDNDVLCLETINKVPNEEIKLGLDYLSSWIAGRIEIPNGDEFVIDFQDGPLNTNDDGMFEFKYAGSDFTHPSSWKTKPEWINDCF